jgi:hypothetical protein
LREWFQEIDTDLPSDGQRREFARQRFLTDPPFMRLVERRRLEVREDYRKAGTDFDDDVFEDYVLQALSNSLDDRSKVARRDRTHPESASPQAHRTLASPKGRRNLRSPQSVRRTPVTPQAVCHPSATALEESGLPRHTTRASSQILGRPFASPRGSPISQMFPAPSQLSPSPQSSFSPQSRLPSRHSSLHSPQRIAPNHRTVTRPFLISKRQKTSSFEASFLASIGAAIRYGIINRDTVLNYLHSLPDTPDTPAIPAVDCSIDETPPPPLSVDNSLKDTYIPLADESDRGHRRRRHPHIVPYRRNRIGRWTR